jgi:1,4-dihydroxy-6-naphthoate synthase
LRTAVDREAPDRAGRGRCGRLRIAIPGRYTTANFLSVSRFPTRRKTELVFFSDRAGAAEGRLDAGLIIHENRFTYEAKGLKKIIDLGEFWETEIVTDSARRHRHQTRAARRRSV